jgi:hypothetical protein
MHSKHSSALPLGGPRRTALSPRNVQTGQSRHPNRTHACALGPASCCSTSRISALISPHRAPCYRDQTRFLLSHTQPNHCFRFISSQDPITHLPDPHTPTWTPHTTKQCAHYDPRFSDSQPTLILRPLHSQLDTLPSLLVTAVRTTTTITLG